MARVAFPITVFYDPSGAPLAGGYVTIALTEDVWSPSGQMCGSFSLNVALSNLGEMLVVPQVYACADLVPEDARYVLTSFTYSGEKVSGPDFVIV
jgi:hypothetical protein